MGALSGGELQRVLLAQALVPTPELLLLDEPSRGIDRRALEFAERALRQLREQGKTILIVTHDLEQVGRLADRVTCLNRKTRFDGPPSEVLTLEAALGAFSHAENEGV